MSHAHPGVYWDFDDASPHLPILSTDGAPQMNVLVFGSSERGYRLWKSEASTPLGGGDAFVGGEGSTGMTATTPGFTGRTVAPASGAALCVLSAAFVSATETAPWTAEAPDLARARASSSTSVKTSCLTAPMEYAHTPTAKPASTTPVMALRSRNGWRARCRPGDMICGGVFVACRET